MARSRKRRGRGEGSVFQRADGKWVGAISGGYDAAGKRRRSKVIGDSKQEVVARLDELRKRQGLPAEAGKTTLAEYLGDWLEACAPDLAPMTTERREGQVRVHIVPRLGHLKLAALSPGHVERFLGDLHRDGVPAPTRRFVADVLSVALNRAVRLRLIPLNPADAVSKPRVAVKEMRVLDQAQVRALLGHTRPDRWRALFALAVGSGMRRGELLGLAWRDIDFEAGAVNVRHSLSKVKCGFALRPPKTAAGRRKIVLPAFVLDELATHRRRQLAAGLLGAPVFCTSKGRYILPHHLLSAVLKPLLARAGLPHIRFHDLRHTHASHLLSQGASVRAVASRLGHANPALTLRVYGHTMPNDDLQLAGKVQTLFG
jgi:integrase